MSKKASPKLGRSEPHNIESQGVARVLSKLGICSRKEAFNLISQGRVTLNGRIVTDGQQRCSLKAKLLIDGREISKIKHFYLALNKPRGLVTTASDEKDRDTVFKCFETANFPHMSAVGRLDQASEGLLLFTNDTAWAEILTNPLNHINKVYHVQIDKIVDSQFLEKLVSGTMVDGDFLAVKNASILRQGEQNSWLELTIDEGKNRHLRRLLLALGATVLRLVRVSIGELTLGSLEKGKWRTLTDAEVLSLRNCVRSSLK